MIEKPSRLPSNYQEVEYIESTGTQYIKTTFVPSYSTRVVMRAIVTNHSANGAFFGARSSSSLTGLSYSLILLAGGIVRSDYYGTEVNVTTAPLSQEITIDKNKNVCTVNGVTATNTTSTSKSAYPLYLFAVNTAGTASLFGKFRLPETQIYDNGTLKLHYIPCYRKSDKEAGVYDLVSDTFESNAGSGKFNVGANVGEIIIIDGGVIPKKHALRRRMMSAGIIKPDENTLLLLHGEDFADSSMYKRGITNSGASLDGTNKKFGLSSLYFNGSTRLNLNDNSYLNFGTGNFTIDWWERPTATINGGNPFTFEKDAKHFLLLYAGDNILLYMGSYGGTAIGTYTLNVWTHRAFVRSGNTLLFFQNGTLVWSGSFTGNAPYTAGYQACIGGRSDMNQYFIGNIDEFRVSNVARWTANFTPPTKPY